MLLQGKSALITGGGRGIGRAVAEVMAREGAQVMICDKGTTVESSGEGDPSVAATAAAELNSAGAEALASEADVTDPDAVQSAFDQAIAAWGRVDVVVNAAGIIRDRMLWNVPEQEWDDIVDVHLKGCYSVGASFARHVRSLDAEQRGDASLITFSSSAGVFGNIGSSAYGAAKSGVLGYTRIAALELARLGVRVNCVVPFAWTRMAEVLPDQGPEAEARLARLRQLVPEQVANLIVWIAATEDPELTGQVLGMRGKEMLVFAQPSIHARVGLYDGSPEEITRLLGDRPGAWLPRLRPSGEIFDYDPIV